MIVWLVGNLLSRIKCDGTEQQLDWVAIAQKRTVCLKADATCCAARVIARNIDPAIDQGGSPSRAWWLVPPCLLGTEDQIF